MFYWPNILHCHWLSQPIVHFLPILPTSCEYYSTTSAWFSLCKQFTHQRKPKPSATGLNLQPVLFPTVPTGSLFQQAGQPPCWLIDIDLRYAHWLLSLHYLCSALLTSSLLPIIKCSSFSRHSSSSCPFMDPGSFGSYKSPLLYRVYIDCTMGFEYGCVYLYTCVNTCIFMDTQTVIS